MDRVPPSELQALNDPISEEEVLRVLRKSDNNKSTADGVPLELFKYAQALRPGTKSMVNWTATHIANLLNEAYLVKRRLPSDMYDAYVIPVYKGKGDDKVMDNYRGITITTSLYKIFTTILTRRADTLCEKYAMRALTQCGFRNKHGTIDAIFALNHHIHATCSTLRHGGLGQPLELCFVDFQKAFDCVVRTYVWDRLRAMGFHGPFLEIILDIYSKSSFKIRVGGKVSSRAVVTVSGVKQGCPMSPLILGLFIEQLHELLQLRCPDIGVLVIDETLLRDIFFCDDLALAALLRKELQSLLLVVGEFSGALGQPVNVRKTEGVTCLPKGLPTMEQSPLMYEGAEIKQSEIFKYLGLWLHHRDWFAMAGQNMAEAAEKAMWAMLRLCRTNDIQLLETQNRLFYDSCCLCW